MPDPKQDTSSLPDGDLLTGNRRALLIGAERYGKDFPSLPSARNDVGLMRQALQRCGFHVDVCPDDDVRNAATLDKTIRDFCRSCQTGDVHVVYFSGHGMLVDGTDCIIPAGVSRRDALDSPNQRVSTDLSRVMDRDDAGLAVFVIDACRNPDDEPKTKGASAWGDPLQLEVPNVDGFVRLFGCRSGEVCQVLPAADDQVPVSVFSKALANVLTGGAYQSLHDVLSAADVECRKMAETYHLTRQMPHLSHGETSARTRALLDAPIFVLPAAAQLSQLWESFDPARLHCLVVMSEQDQSNASWGVTDLVRDALAGATGTEIWTAFRACVNGRCLVSDQRRDLPEQYDASAVSFGFFSVLDALASADALDRGVRALVEADLVVFDVTGFEPAVMMLVGIRAACARGVDICSHGGAWREGQPLPLPFNLQNLNLNSHTPTDAQVGDDAVVGRFVNRVVMGYRQFSRHAHYLDLPVYDDVRQLGSQYEASSSIGVRERVLAVCSYRPEYFASWRYVRSSLKQALWNKWKLAPEVARIIDYGTPQLVSQTLYEQLRRVTACVMDWTDFSESAFVELGARLAISEWGAVQIVDRQCLPGGERAKPLRQIERLARIFQPSPYNQQGGLQEFEPVVNTLAGRNPSLAAAPEYNRIHRVVLETIGKVHPSNSAVYEELREAADSLHHPDQGREARPQVVFHGSFRVKRDSERAALERRVAAWLYLEHRLKVGAGAADAALLETYRKLGRTVCDGLNDIGGEEDLALADVVEARLRQVKTP